MKKIILFILVSGIICAQQQIDIPWPTLSNSDWPMIKRDPQFTGRSPYKGPQTPNVVWIKNMPNGIFSGPVIGEEGNLYFGSYYVFGDDFYSYRPDGNQIWTFGTGSGRATQSGILIDSSGTIYFGSRDSCLYALNSGGILKWKYKTSGAITQEVIPNIDLGCNIYITNINGELYCIKVNGTLNWQMTYESGFGGKSPVFSPDGNTIYIAGLDSNLFALNLDGSIKWKLSCGNILRAPMVDSEGNIYAVASNHLYCISPAGNINWSYFLLGTPLAIPTIDKDGNIYTIAWDTTYTIYYPALISLRYDGTFRWKYIFIDHDVNHFDQPLICDWSGTVYVGSTLGADYYAISNVGELKWKLPLIIQHQQVDNTGAIAKDGTLFLGVHDVSLLPGQIKTLIAIRDTVTSVEEQDYESLNYGLEQNYPNPFNSTTNIRYSIPVSDRATIKVFDLLGKEVATLLDRYQQAGSYDVIFQPNNLTSGIYFYTLTSGNFTATKKLILLK
ncbi:MAG: PQQ-binding-like beta-propeller repeat protein [Ignavibacteriaceae bacterium]